MHKGYLYTRVTIDVIGLYNPEDAFWWRDKNWNSQDKYVNDKPVYWSRGNGWVYAALVADRKWPHNTCRQVNTK